MVSRGKQSWKHKPKKHIFGEPAFFAYDSPIYFQEEPSLPQIALGDCGVVCFLRVLVLVHLLS
ncbi:MAG: hypothetical protein ACI89U_003215 [Gammaproteobacteria bacterium]|jgi:hypothetical protein